jgi:hypothetical protein
MTVVMVTRMKDDEIDPLMSLEKKFTSIIKIKHVCMHVPWCNNYFIMLPHIEIQLRYDSNIQPIDQTKKIIT